MTRRLRLGAAMATVVTMLAAGSTTGAEPPGGPDDQRLPQPLEAQMDLALRDATGDQLVSIRLAEPAAAQVAPARQKAQKAEVKAQQDRVLAALRKADANVRTVARTSKALNAVIAVVDASALPGLRANPDVVSVSKVRDYQLDLSETVPYIGGTAVQAAGFDGTGVTVAVLDSGVDYTHAALGGPGTVAAYEAAYGTSTSDPRNTTRDGLFPTAKVVEGRDFVGEAWPGGALAQDPDPIDFEGHGTHVADIIGGDMGVAPGASILAVKVCSAVSTSCSGVALLQGMDYALDPNGDDDLSDRVDVINMSLGSPYGSAFDDDLSQAVENATAAGVLTVASAGNSGDKPYVAGTPSAAPSALSVAQTSVPSATLPLLELTAPPAVAGTKIPGVFQPWSVPVTVPITGPVQYGDGAGGNLLGCTAFAPGSLAGKIVLVNRGTCGFSIKISNIAAGGALAGVIGLVAPGDPFEGGFSGGTPSIPGFMISQTNSNLIKANLAAGVVMKIDPAGFLPLVRTMVGSSSRGPAMGSNIVKPEIGAPGASVSAVAGSGDGVEPFGGTSGAAPMVSGAAALLHDAFPTRSALELKAVLMNTAETEIMNSPAAIGGKLAAIQRIGDGEVRVDRALASPAAAWDTNFPSAVLSFGMIDVTKSTESRTKNVTVRNYSGVPITYAIAPTFRFADDAANGAVEVKAPRSITVPANGSARFDVTIVIRGDKLRTWTANSGPLGANPAPFDLLDYDGYVQLTSSSSNLHVGWHVLPRKAPDVSVVQQGSRWRVTNKGIAATPVEEFSLLGTSPDLPEGGPGENNPVPDLQAVGFRSFDGTGSCPSDSWIGQFAITTWERIDHAIVPAQAELDIDVDGDGSDDFAVLNADVTLSTVSDGRVLSWVVNLRTGQASGFFFADHEANSNVMVLTFCGSQIGSVSAVPPTMKVRPLMFDNYYTGTVTDSMPRVTVNGTAKWSTGLGDPVIAPNGVVTASLSMSANPAATGSGSLLLFRGGGPVGTEAVALLP